MGQPGDCLDVRLMQFVTLYRGGEKVQMSTRSGEFVTLRELRARSRQRRGALLLRDAQQRPAPGLRPAAREVAQSNDNPVYYIQYAHARVCSVLRQMREKGFEYDAGRAAAQASLGSTEPHEQALLATMSRYPGGRSSRRRQQRAPHALVHYLRELATDFHAYYNAHQFLVDDAVARCRDLSRGSR